LYNSPEVSCPGLSHRAPGRDICSLSRDEYSLSRSIYSLGRGHYFLSSKNRAKGRIDSALSRNILVQGRKDSDSGPEVSALSRNK